MAADIQEGAMRQADAVKGMPSAQELAEQWQALAQQQQDEDGWLCQLAGAERLEDVSSLQMVVSTSTSTIAHLGPKLPNLLELNLCNSFLESIRDLGTGFRCLQVLWITRCGLTSLDGIAALCQLRELYAAFNDVSDLSPLRDLAQLEVLDLEGNCVSELDNLGHVQQCPLLHSITLAGNPIAGHPSYRQYARKLLPRLELLDDDVATRMTDQQRQQWAGRPQHQQQQGWEPTALGAPGSAVPALPAVASGAVQAELAFTYLAIKHAREGLDSKEFQELLAAAVLSGALSLSSSTPSDRPSSADTASGSRPGSASWTSVLRTRSAQLLSGGGGSILEAFGSHRSTRSDEDAGSSSNCSTRPSSAARRPPTPGGPDSASGAAAATAATRPFSASVQTTRQGSAGVGASLFWRKHRIGSAGAVLGAAASDAGAAADSSTGGGNGGGDGVAGSRLTHGVTPELTFGGNLARRLRKWKSGGDGSTGGGGGGGAKAPATASARELRIDAPLATLLSKDGGTLEQQALLEQLRQWKVDTADKALLPEDAASDMLPAALAADDGSSIMVAAVGGPGEALLSSGGAAASGAWLPSSSTADRLVIGGGGDGEVEILDLRHFDEVVDCRTPPVRTPVKAPPPQPLHLHHHQHRDGALPDVVSGSGEGGVAAAEHHARPRKFMLHKVVHDMALLQAEMEASGLHKPSPGLSAALQQQAASGRSGHARRPHPAQQGPQPSSAGLRPLSGGALNSFASTQQQQQQQQLSPYLRSSPAKPRPPPPELSRSVSLEAGTSAAAAARPPSASATSSTDSPRRPAAEGGASSRGGASQGALLTPTRPTSGPNSSSSRTPSRPVSGGIPLREDGLAAGSFGGSRPTSREADAYGGSGTPRSPLAAAALNRSVSGRLERHSSRLSDGGGAAGAAGGKASAAGGSSSSSSYSVTSVVGEVDVATMNPQPLIRADADSDSDEDLFYVS